jgi:hypothetical protein
MGCWVVVAFSIASMGLTEPQPARIRFENIAPEIGLNFVLRESATPQKHQIETMVGGVAVFDYNNGDRLDIYFVNGIGSRRCLAFLLCGLT